MEGCISEDVSRMSLNECVSVNMCLWLSFAGEVIVEMDMYGGEVLLFGWDFQFLVHGGLVNDAVISESGVHVEYFALALPGVALGVYVYFLVAVEDLPYGFFTWDFELVLSVAEGVDDAYFLRFFGEFAYEVLLVFPPWNGQRVFLQIQMQILSKRNIELLHPLGIDKCARVSRFFIEPAGDIGPSCLDNWFGLGCMAIFLYELGEIVDIIEEGYPDIVGRVMVFELGEGVVSSLVVWFGE